MKNKEKNNILKRTIKTMQDNKDLIDKLKKDILEKEQYLISISEFMENNSIRNQTHLEEAIIDYNHFFNINNSDYIKKLKEIKHEFSMIKFDTILNKINIIKYNKIKKGINKNKEYIKDKLKTKININKNILYELDKLEEDLKEWSKIPKCFKCDCVFNDKNPRFDIKKYDLNQLCRECTMNQLKEIIRNKKCIKEIDKKYINNNVVNKLLSKSYYDICFYSDIYSKNIEEKVDLHDDTILRYAGFEVKNDFDKYKLSNLCYRSNKLIELFSDKIDFINISEWELARMGKLEFEALCNVIGEKVGYKRFNEIIYNLSIDNDESPEIASDYSDIEEEQEHDYRPPSYDYDSETCEFEEQFLEFQKKQVNLDFD